MLLAQSLYYMDEFDNEIDDYLHNKMLVEIEEGLLLTNEEINTLKKYDITTDKFNSMKELLFLLDEVMEDDLDEEEYNELDYIASKISERDYYENTNK